MKIIIIIMLILNINNIYAENVFQINKNVYKNSIKVQEKQVIIPPIQEIIPECGIDYLSCVNGNALITSSIGSNNVTWNCTSTTQNSISCTKEAQEGINGSCGSANGTTVNESPTNNLCQNGTPTSVTLNGNNYQWSCNGQIGTETIKNGTHQNCTATKSNCEFSGLAKPTTNNTGYMGAADGKPRRYIVWMNYNPFRTFVYSAEGTTYVDNIFNKEFKLYDATRLNLSTKYYAGNRVGQTDAGSGYSNWFYEICTF